MLSCEECCLIQHTSSLMNLSKQLARSQAEKNHEPLQNTEPQKTQHHLLALSSVDSFTFGLVSLGFVIGVFPFLFCCLCRVLLSFGMDWFICELSSLY